MEKTKTKWYQTTWASILFLFLFFPVGLFLMWKYTSWPKFAKWTITGFFGLIILSSALTDSPETTNTNSAETQEVSQPTQVPQEETVAEPTQEVIKDTETTTPTTTESQDTTSPAASETVSQKNAVRKAKSYLNFTGFSRDGLVEQLEYEQFSHEDAVYGADNSGADWNEQAAKKAASYMEFSAFSRGSLIEQLLYEKFTQEQAEYGADSVGL